MHRSVAKVLDEPWEKGGARKRGRETAPDLVVSVTLYGSELGAPYKLQGSRLRAGAKRHQAKSTRKAEYEGWMADEKSLSKKRIRRELFDEPRKSRKRYRGKAFDARQGRTREGEKGGGVLVGRLITARGGEATITDITSGGTRGRRTSDAEHRGSKRPPLAKF